MLTRRHRAPVLRSLNLLPDGVHVVAQFDQHVRATTPEDGWTFTIDAGEGTEAEATITEAVVEGPNVVFALGQAYGDGDDLAIFTGQTLDAVYVADDGSLTGGGVAPVVADIDEAVSNLSEATIAAPELVSAVIGATGLAITLTFDETVTGDGDLGMTVSDGVTVTAGDIAANVITLTVGTTIVIGDIRTFTYDSGTGDLAGFGGAVDDITDHAITNNSAVAP